MITALQRPRTTVPRIRRPTSPPESVHYDRQVNETILSRRYELLGENKSTDQLTHRLVDPFTIHQPPHALRQSHQAEFTVRENKNGLVLHFLADGRVTVKDQPVADGFAYLRSDMFRPGGEPRLLDSVFVPTTLFRMEQLDGGRLLLVPVWDTARPRERFVVDSDSGRLLEEIVAVRSRYGPIRYWQIDYQAGTAVRTDSQGLALTGRTDQAIVTTHPDGTVQLFQNGTGTPLFERLSLKSRLRALRQTQHVPLPENLGGIAEEPEESEDCIEFHDAQESWDGESADDGVGLLGGGLLEEHVDDVGQETWHDARTEGTDGDLPGRVLPATPEAGFLPGLK
ncbi:MAG: hypothetical protein JO362_11360 [Streptomycetaceae bacterium]|nr:hypothetical protein [Streptomycetaceae bacterium]